MLVRMEEPADTGGSIGWKKGRKSGVPLVENIDLGTCVRRSKCLMYGIRGEERNVVPVCVSQRYVEKMRKSAGMVKRAGQPT